MSLPLEQIRAAADERRAALFAFTKKIVRIPSLPGHEGDVAGAIITEMERLNYDKVWTDKAGNIIGQINGGQGPTVLLNGHMDHVDPGPAEGWPYPPFSGQIVDGELWGRASVDMKGPVACMIYALGLFKKMGLKPPGNVLMTVPVMEEVGGLGTQYLASRLKGEAAICGEPSHNTLRRGHRGRIGLKVTFKGRSAHASAPHLGHNPHYVAATFLTKLKTLEMETDDTLGPATVAPTLYATDQVSPNVIPSEVYIDLDWRNVPDELPTEILDRVQKLADACLADQATEMEAVVEISTSDFTTYTGLKKKFPAVFPSFLLADDHPVLTAAQSTLANVVGEERGVDIWRFATDGGHLMTSDIPTIGFGPGDETLAHTNRERISLAQMEEAVVAYAALTLSLADAVGQT